MTRATRQKEKEEEQAGRRATRRLSQQTDREGGGSSKGTNAPAARGRGLKKLAGKKAAFGQEKSGKKAEEKGKQPTPCKRVSIVKKDADVASGRTDPGPTNDGTIGGKEDPRRGSAEASQHGLTLLQPTVVEISAAVVDKAKAGSTIRWRISNTASPTGGRQQAVLTTPVVRKLGQREVPGKQVARRRVMHCARRADPQQREHPAEGVSRKQRGGRGQNRAKKTLMMRRRRMRGMRGMRRRRLMRRRMRRKRRMKRMRRRRTERNRVEGVVAAAVADIGHVVEHVAAAAVAPPPQREASATTAAAAAGASTPCSTVTQGTSHPSKQ
ncbi:unnamed protein product [Closterium sp. NIES-53]